jgi:hypothetical protein
VKPKIEEPSYHLIGGKATHRTLYISEKFTQNQRQAIKEEALVWQNKTNAIVTFDFEKLEGNYLKATNNPKDSLVIQMLPIEDLFVQEQDLNARKKSGNDLTIILGAYDIGKHPVPTIIIVDERIKTESGFKNVALHEIGHALELDHDSNEEAIMYKDVGDWAKTVTLVDLAAFCKLHSCAIKAD